MQATGVSHAKSTLVSFQLLGLTHPLALIFISLFVVQKRTAALQLQIAHQ